MSASWLLYTQCNANAARIDEKVQRRKPDIINNKSSFIFLKKKKFSLSYGVSHWQPQASLSSEFVKSMISVFFVYALLTVTECLGEVGAISCCASLRMHSMTGTKNAAAITKGQVAVE